MCNGTGLVDSSFTPPRHVLAIDSFSANESELVSSIASAEMVGHVVGPGTCCTALSNCRIRVRHDVTGLGVCSSEDIHRYPE